MTLEEIVRLTARVAGLPCHIVPLPDVIARLQGMVMGLLPGKPFSLDNFRSLTIDSVCRENGCAALGIVPAPMLAVLPGYLGPRPEGVLDLAGSARVSRRSRPLCHTSAHAARRAAASPARARRRRSAAGRCPAPAAPA